MITRVTILCSPHHVCLDEGGTSRVIVSRLHHTAVRYRQLRRVRFVTQENTNCITVLSRKTTNNRALAFSDIVEVV